MRRNILGMIACVGTLVCAACAGSHSFVPAQTVQPGVLGDASGTTKVTVAITVATKSAPATEARMRHPQYFSRSSRGLLISASIHGKRKIIAQAAVDISPGSAACGGKKSTPRTCTATLMLAPSKGIDFTLIDYSSKPKSNKIPKGAHVLAIGKLVNKKISASAKKNRFTVFLGGVVQRIATTSAPISFAGDGRDHSAAILIDPVDFGNNPITAGRKDPYANPISASVTETGGTGHTLLSLNGGAGATSVTLKYSTDTVEVKYDGGGSVGYGATVSLRSAKVKNSGGARALVGIAPLIVGSTSTDLSSGSLTLKGNGDYVPVQISEANAPAGTAFTVSTRHCDAIESTIRFAQSSASSGSFAAIARGVAATPSPAGCGIVVSDGTNSVSLIVSNSYSSGSLGSPSIATTPIPASASKPIEMTVGPDGALWFAECGAGALGRVAAGPIGSNAIHQYPLPAASATPGATGVYAGPDGTVWFTDEANNTAGNMTAAGSLVRQQTVGDGATPEPAFVTTGADGNMWFSYWCDQKISTMPTSGSPIGNYSANLSDNYLPTMALGPDGNMWFTENDTNKIGKITTAGTITEYDVPTGGSRPWGITAGPDGAMWFTECNGGSGNGAIGRIPVTATVLDPQIQEFSTGMTGDNPVDITVGPDGALWFPYWTAAAKVGRITTAGVITEYAIPGASSSYNGWGITAGPDGAIWFDDNIDNAIGRIALPGITPSVGHANSVHRLGGTQRTLRPSQRHRRRGLTAR